MNYLSNPEHVWKWQYYEVWITSFSSNFDVIKLLNYQLNEWSKGPDSTKIQRIIKTVTYIFHAESIKSEHSHLLSDNSIYL